MGGLEETGGGRVMGTGLGLLVRDRKTEIGDMEVGPRDLGMGDGWISALTQASRGNWAQQPPPMRPTNQVTSISEVLFPGGGSDKMSYPLSCLLVSSLWVWAVFSSQQLVSRCIY